MDNQQESGGQGADDQGRDGKESLSPVRPGKEG